MKNGHDAQREVERIRIFREQLAELERDRVLELSAEQRERLNEHLNRLQNQLARDYDVDISASQKQLSLGMKIVSALGGLALCVGVFLFFIRFWGLMTTPVQVAILIAAPLLGLAGMEFASRRERTLYFTALIGMVTVAAFVLDLMALGQIFNITPSPNAFLIWGAFAMVLAYAFRLRLLLAGGLAGLTMWVTGTLAVSTGAYWTAGFERAENYLLPAAAIMVYGVLRRE